MESVKHCPKCLANYVLRVTKDYHVPDCELLTSVIPEWNNDMNFEIMSDFYGDKSTTSYYQISCDTHDYTAKEECGLDVTNDKGYSITNIEGRLHIDVVALMYQKALEHSRTFPFGLPTQPPSSMLTYAAVDIEFEYMKVPFIESTNGGILLRSMD